MLHVHCTYPHLVSLLAYGYDLILYSIVLLHPLTSESKESLDKHPAYLTTSVQNKKKYSKSSALLWKSVKF